MSDAGEHEAREHQFAEVSPTDAPPGRHLQIEDLNDISLGITADLGNCTLPLRDILELKRGSVIPLDKLAGEMTDICVNGLPLAKGEVVVIGDTLHVRIAEILGTVDKDKPDGEWEEEIVLDE